MLDLYDELANIVGALSRLNCPYALVGGLAVSLYTRPRATEDIDLMIREQDWTVIRSQMNALGYLIEAHPMPMTDGHFLIRRVTKLADGDHVIVEILIPKSDETAGMLERSVRVRWQDREISIAGVDDLKRLKRLGGAPQDLADIEALEGRSDRHGQA